MTTGISPARRAGAAYVSAVNAGDADRLVALFTADAALRHPAGTFAGHDAIRRFYEDVVFAGQAEVTLVRCVSESDVAVIELEVTSPSGEPGDRQHVVDVLAVDAGGRITALDVYYR